MISIINNKEKNMIDSLRDALNQSDSVDIRTAFFYFSGFNALAKELKNKKIRILVGNIIDPKRIKEFYTNIKNNPEEFLENYAVCRQDLLDKIKKKDIYINNFIDFVNNSPLSEEFDSTESQKTFRQLFLSKIKNGSLEIKLTAKPDHGKAYIFTKSNSLSQFDKGNGFVIMGSSNFTYNGLLGQGEINEKFEDNDHYYKYKNDFEELWKDSKSIDICTNNGSNFDFITKLEEKLWIFAKPTPYQIFIRILYELFNIVEKSVIKTPDKITNGKFFNLKYQIDAVKLGIDCINKNSGVIIADVVGLGKSIIALTIANNLDVKKTVIIAPPHLIKQWEDYQQEFELRGVKIYSSGKISDAYKNHIKDSNPILYIIDEAHRYRNELTSDYKMLHQLTRSNSNNKVILLTATPYNNKPSDLLALIKLFQTPKFSTISSIKSLDIKFSELISNYDILASEKKKNLFQMNYSKKK